MKFCPKCGTQLSDAAKFCKSCGFQMPAAQAQAAPNQQLQQQYAPNQQPQQQYAPNQQLSPNQQPASGQTIYAGQQAQQYTPEPAQQYYQQPPVQPVPAADTLASAKPKSKAPIIAVAAVAVVAVGVASFFGIRALTKDDDDDDKKSSKKKDSSDSEVIEEEELDDSESEADESFDDDSSEAVPVVIDDSSEYDLPESSEPEPVVVDNSNTGKVYNIYCWNTEFKDRFEGYYWDNRDTALWDGVEVNWVINENMDNNYQTKLDEAISDQNYAADDDKVDMFLVEADYAIKYLNSDAPLDVRGEIGLTDEDLANQYQYTKDVMTDANGTLKGVSWQACPGLFLYNAKYARSVLGTDDPDKVQKMLSDWDKFEDVAAKMKKKGIAMVSGFDDTYRCFSNNVSNPWVDSSGRVSIDPQLKAWVDMTKKYTDKGYNNKTSLWDDYWKAGQKIDGKVFGYFYSSWGIPFTLLPNTVDEEIEADGSNAKKGNGGYGEWRACLGPQSYFWGGTWLCGCYGSDNVAITRDIMLKLTCDTDIMAQITADTQDYTNNKASIAKLVSNGYKNDFLGGQDHLSLLSASADKIDMKNKLSAYDQGCNERFQGAMTDYFLGNCSYEDALENFKNRLVDMYWELDVSDVY